MILFFVLAALPSTVVTGFSLSALDQFIRDEVTRQQQDLEKLIRFSLTNEQNRIRKQLTQLRNDERVQQMTLQSDEANALVDFEELAVGLSSKAELSALGFIALTGPAKNTILSSSHMPQAAGDAPPTELFLKDIVSSTTGIASDYFAANPPSLLPLLLATELVTDSTTQRKILIYGGTRLDGPFLDRIAQMTSSKLILKLRDGVTYEFGTIRTGESSGLESQFVIPISGYADRFVGGNTKIYAFLPASPLEKLREELVLIGMFASLVILLGGILGGLWLSRPITRPIVALASAAKQVGDGNYQIRVTKERNDEVGELVEVFNHMVGEIVETQAELAQAERMAAWRDAAKQVAHEIKNPLTPMRMSMETLRKAHRIQHASFDEILEESTQAVLEEVQALSKIVSAFSEFAKLPTPILKRHEPVQLLSSVNRLYGTLPENIELVYDDAAIRQLELPKVLVDKEQFSRVFVNLVKNAVEAIGTAQGRISLDAHVATNSNTNGVKFTISDNGPGIAAETLSKVLTPYFTTKSKGTGLGLAIVNKIVEEHRGILTIDSRLNHGTSISIWIPVE